jgi:uncharacterized protein
VIAHFILFVSSQESSTRFYSAVLDREPSLDVPGMTEFILGEHCILGLMPLAGIKRLLGVDALQAGSRDAPPRTELYLRTPDAAACFDRALAMGARLLSAMQMRDWGDVAGYLLDPDGHVVAFAESAIE